MSATPPPGPQDVHVVILNWHGREDTVACVRSVLADGADPGHVVVVDNGSFDGTESALAREGWGVRFVQAGTNLGFAAGMNRGLHECLDSGARYVCVLNNDTDVVPGMFAALLGHLDDDVAVSPEVRYRADPSTSWFGGGVVERRLCWPRHLTPPELAARDESDPQGTERESEILAGCCILASASTWRRVGLFDPAYFLIFEDSDWSLRARRAGVRLIVARDALLLHAVSASFSGPGQLLSSYYYGRNGMRFARTRVTRRPLPRLRFWRDRLVLPAARRVKAGEVVPGLLQLAFTLAGVTADLLRSTGRAPSAVEGLAARIAGTTRPEGSAGSASEADSGTRTPGTRHRPALPAQTGETT